MSFWLLDCWLLADDDADEAELAWLWLLGAELLCTARDDELEACDLLAEL